MSRERHAPLIHDGEILHPHGCPRNATDCLPLARVASPGFESFMCCGETSGAPVPEDVLRLCIKSAYGVDVLVNFDARDAIDTASVLMGGLSSFAALKASLPYPLQPPAQPSPDSGAAEK